ncbi:KH domain-containing protein [Candidatus Saccharibacteria bacterium]|nr:KH domain-containing protein [Candidatus Saccharibacteria bacterium]HOR23353.1 KH domain-containing protein [Candidatus Saccharibacteria bacterium]HPW47885.1 KH domain-containing protein [Candidatus Saccharibacteria bacterium]
MSTIDQQFVEFIIKSLVSKPEAVKVERRIDEKGVLLELTVDPEDLGRVIGKRGATAQSIRSLLRALGTKNDARYNLKIVDNGVEQSEKGSYKEKADTDYSSPDTDTSDDEKEATEEIEEPPEDTEDEEKTEPSNMVSRARKELEELDDLEV